MQHVDGPGATVRRARNTEAVLSRIFESATGESGPVNRTAGR
ncbi:hypothetical protein FHR32_003776 [Streptosporangium album]|uniref:Uncharacterized protein n=1 Tax=Streptosporangium album TaxID=47479 RepID=A0A7W7RWF3_9ACTN|nr:hypothetical protein [Streptosporangium album]MBB4939471.1 hypothetical protein [Streptosporangium album]